MKEEDINLVLTEIAKSNNIFSYSKNELLALLKRKTLFVLYDEQKLIGLSAYKEINKDWVELALLLVVSRYRNQGYGKRIAKELFQRLQGRNVYCCSRNPIVQNWLLGNGFKEISFYKLPREIIVYLLKTKFKFYKLKSLLQGIPLNGWKYYLKFKN